MVRFRGFLSCEFFKKVIKAILNAVLSGFSAIIFFMLVWGAVKLARPVVGLIWATVGGSSLVHSLALTTGDVAILSAKLHRPDAWALPACRDEHTVDKVSEYWTTANFQKLLVYTNTSAVQFIPRNSLGILKRINSRHAQLCLENSATDQECWWFPVDWLEARPN